MFTKPSVVLACLRTHFESLGAGKKHKFLTQGPPETSPGCGEDWVCEHRWKSIGQMAEFTNTVAGEPSIFKVADYHTLGMARGNKGFFAMGDLDREFDTGLPDGEYCDIISECQQKITVSKWYKDE